jgi:hypothetical protein
MKIKRAKHDALISMLQRCSTDYTCDWCGKYYDPEKGLSKGIHASHYWGRGIRQLRWWHENLTTACYGCHIRAASDPWKHTQMMIQRLGLERMQELEKMAYSKYKLTTKDKNAALDHLAEQWRVMSIKRREGVRGPLPYQGWLPCFQ